MATVAVFDRVPVNPVAIVAVTVNVALPPAARSTVVPMSPRPFTASHAEPAGAVHDHTAPTSAAGRVSTTGASSIRDGPLFVTTIV